jgi:hypothetical protein
MRATMPPVVRRTVTEPPVSTLPQAILELMPEDRDSYPASNMPVAGQLGPSHSIHAINAYIDLSDGSLRGHSRKHNGRVLRPSAFRMFMPSVFNLANVDNIIHTTTEIVHSNPFHHCSLSHRNVIH